MDEKTYYDWLEVSPKASSEVIEKAYKALVRKYHPDLQEDNRQEAEELMKKINEAYDVLSNNEKRIKYDADLKLNQEHNQTQNHIQQTTNNNISKQHSIHELAYQQKLALKRQQQLELERQRQAELAQIEYQRQVDAARQKAYHDAYIQDLKNRGYKIRYKKTFKDYVRVAITILIIILVLFVAWQIPFIRNWFIDLYNDNELIQIIVNVFNK